MLDIRALEYIALIIRKLDNNSKLSNYLNTPFNKYLFSLFAAGSVFSTDSVGVLGSAGTQKEISLAKQTMPP